MFAQIEFLPWLIVLDPTLRINFGLSSIKNDFKALHQVVAPPFGKVLYIGWRYDKIPLLQTRQDC